MDTAEDEFDIREILGVIRRQYKLILVCLFAGLALCAIWIFSVTPSYTATTLVLVDPSTKNLLSPDTNGTALSSDSARIDSEVEILKSDSTLMQVVQSENLVSDEEFGIEESTRNQILNWLHLPGVAPEEEDEQDAWQKSLNKLGSALSVQRRGLTYLIAVEVSSESPDKAARLADAVAQTYINDQLRAKVDSVLASRDILNSRISDASQAIAESEKALDDYLFSNLDTIASETGRSDLAQLHSRLSLAEAERQRMTDLAAAVDAGIENKNWQTLVETLRSDTLAELEQQRERLLDDIEAVPDSEQSVDLEAELAQIELQITQIASEEQSRLQQQIGQTQSLVTELRGEIRDSAISADLPTDMVARIYELQQNATVARSQYQTLLLRLREVETQADLQLADSRIVSNALPPQTPSFPNKRLFLALAGMMGLGVGVGMAFLTEFYFGGFTSEGQAESVLRQRVVAVVPRLKKRGQSEAETKPAEALVSAPLSTYSESIRRIRAGVDQLVHLSGKPDAAEHPRGTVVVVSSALPNEGKSTLALSLARACTLSGQKTLLIDADLRKPTIHKQLGVESSSGLYSYLASSDSAIPLTEILSKDHATGLDVIIGEGRSSAPTDQLVASQRFASMVESATRHFDMLIIDTPPVGPVVDALYLARYADVLILVARWASTSQTDVKSALARLAQAITSKTRIGVVLNQQEDAARSRYYKYYRYSGYYEED